MKLVATLLFLFFTTGAYCQYNPLLGEAIVEAIESFGDGQVLLKDSFNRGDTNNPILTLLDLNNINIKFKQKTFFYSTELYPLTKDSIFLFFQRWDLYKCSRKNWGTEGYIISKFEKEQFFFPHFLIVFNDTSYTILPLYSFLRNRDCWWKRAVRPRMTYDSMNEYFPESTTRFIKGEHK